MKVTIEDEQPEWAKRMELQMARVEDKLAELEAAQSAKAAELSAALDGIQGDLSTQAAEIEALKQAVIDAGSNPGELSPELAARFDALKTSLDTVVQKAEALDAILPPPELPMPPNPPEEPTA